MFNKFKNGNIMHNKLMKFNYKLVWLCCFLLTVAIFSSPLKAQVTIGSLNPPSNNALLDLKETVGGSSERGMLLPRVPLSSTTSFAPMISHEAGLYVYNTATVNDVKPGIYYNNGTKWIRLNAAPNFFYMPSILLPIDINDPVCIGGTFTVDLYAQYSTQFTLALPTSTKNPAATTLTVYSRSELDYFVIYYDAAVFSNVSVNNNGVMTYQLVSTPVVSEKTYMNIVFQLKQ